MNIINKLFKSNEFVTPWLTRSQQTLNSKQLKKLEQIALKPNQRIYDQDFFQKKQNYYNICVDLDDTLVLPDKKTREIYLRQYLYKALLEVKKIKGVRLVLWTASLQQSAMDKFLRFPELITLFDEIIFGNHFSTNDKTVSKQIINEETVRLKQFIKEYQSRTDMHESTLNALKKSLDFRKDFINAKNLNLLNYQLLIDNSLAEEISSDWMDYDLLRLPTYDLGQKNESNEFDLIRLELLIGRLPLVVKALIDADANTRQIYLENYQQALTKLYNFYLDQDRHTILSSISEVIVSQELNPLPIHKAIVQNKQFLTFSAVTRKQTSTKEQTIFFKARARMTDKQKSKIELDYRSFKKEIDFLATSNYPFLARYISQGQNNHVVYYTYEYIHVPKFGDTWLINPHTKPSLKTAETIVSHLTALQAMKPEASIQKALKTFDASEAKRIMQIQSKTHHLEIKPILTSSELEQAKKHILDQYSRIEAQDYVLTHGDFHPANILVQNGHVYIIDWEMLQKNNQTFDLTLLWLRSWNYPEWRKYLLDYFVRTNRDQLLDQFFANILFLAPSEIVYWQDVSNEPWRHHHQFATQAISAQRKAFLDALAHFERV